jgi:transposase-like protein
MTSTNDAQAFANVADTGSTGVSGKRRYFSAQDKVAILRQHLLEKIPVSKLCEEHKIAPSLFYLWQREFFENGEAAFRSEGKRADRQAERVEAVKDQKIAALEAKIRRKDEVLGELLEEHVQLKKSLGES